MTPWCLHVSVLSVYAVFVVRVPVLFAGGNIIEIIAALDLGAQISFSSSMTSAKPQSVLFC